MAAKVKALVKPALLVWARESAGLTIEEAAKGVTTDPKKLAAWESGESQPSVPQLRKLATKYKRPLAVFYLAEPPRDFAPLRDFRRLPGQFAGVVSPALRAEIRNAYERRELGLELYDELAQPAPTFTLKATRHRDPEDLGGEIRAFLEVTYEQQSAWRDPRLAYNAWRALIEAKGVLVFQASRIPLKEMRGFVVAEDRLPVIAVNAADHYNARTFSLLDEFAHLVLRVSGISDFSEFNDDELRPPEERTIEVYCNQVVAAVLMPAKLFLAEPLVTQKNVEASWTDDELDTLARICAVSPEAALPSAPLTRPRVATVLSH
jgi:Zn-dependent peptidase ImmA (M78 family)